MRVNAFGETFPRHCPFEPCRSGAAHAPELAAWRAIIGVVDERIIYFDVARRRAVAAPTRPRPASIMA